MTDIATGIAAVMGFLRNAYRAEVDWQRTQFVKELVTALSSPRHQPVVAQPPLSEFIGVGEAAVLLGVTDETVRVYIKDGRLAASRVPGGRIFRIERQAVAHLLSEPSKSSAVDDSVAKVLGRL